MNINLKVLNDRIEYALSCRNSLKVNINDLRLLTVLIHDYRKIADLLEPLELIRRDIERLHNLYTHSEDHLLISHEDIGKLLGVLVPMYNRFLNPLKKL